MRTELLGVISGHPFDFNETALRVFAYQYERCAPFRKYCERRDARPSTVASWKQIPPVPVDIFKHAKLYCGTGEPVKCFLTSGTTGGPETRGKHYFEALDLWNAGERAAFKQSLLTDRDRIRFVFLDAPPDVSPTSALVWYLHTARELFGTPKSDFFVGPKGLRIDALKAALDDASRGGEPVAVLGSAFGFVHAIDAGARSKLPPGSFAVHMGGFKGRSRVLERTELHATIAESFGVERVVNNYSMTEVSTQFYGDEVHLPPRWSQVRMLDPDTFDEVPDGEKGLVSICDLINLDAVAVLVTQDLGIRMPDGTFKVLGRVPGAEARGCSLAMDEFLQGAQ
jgi:hypothetical protein